MQIEKVTWGGWPNCYRLSDAHVELIVTADVGPRILYAGIVGGDNLLYVNEAALGQVGGDMWRMYGGHRFWHAPEHPVRTYVPDNGPVEVQQNGGTVAFIAPPESTTGVQKTLSVSITAGRVRVEHVIHNRNLWDVELAAWGLSVMRAGGVAVIPLPPRGAHPEQLLPNTRLILWPYADLSDPRWKFGKAYLRLSQDPNAPPPQKIGVALSEGWLAYVTDGTLFAKSFAYQADGQYPDMGCNAEIFTNDKIIELESLSTLQHVQSGGRLSHVEHWLMRGGVPTPSSDDDVRAHILPHIEELLR